MNKLGSIGAIGFFLLGIIQFVAGYAGISDALGTFWAILAVIVGVTLRLTLPLTIGAFFGAMNVWGWNWFASALLALPGLVFLIPGVIANIISALKGINESTNQLTNIAINKSEFNFDIKKFIQFIIIKLVKITKIFITSFCVILILLIIYNSYIVYSEWDKIIIDDDVYIKNTEMKINVNGLASLNKIEKDQYLKIKRLKEELEKPIRNSGGISSEERFRKENLDYAAGRTGVAWVAKKIINKIIIYNKIQQSGAKYQRDINFSFIEHSDELTKNIPSSEWSSFSLAKSNAHAKEIRELLLEKNKFLQ